MDTSRKSPTGLFCPNSQLKHSFDLSGKNANSIDTSIYVSYTYKNGWLAHMTRLK
jgi:hypothetical protein